MPFPLPTRSTPRKVDTFSGGDFIKRHIRIKRYTVLLYLLRCLSHSRRGPLRESPGRLGPEDARPAAVIVVEAGDETRNTVRACPAGPREPMLQPPCRCTHMYDTVNIMIWYDMIFYNHAMV